MASHFVEREREPLPPSHSKIQPACAKFEPNSFFNRTRRTEFCSIELGLHANQSSRKSHQRADSVRSAIKGRTNKMIADRPSGRVMNFIHGGGGCGLCYTPALLLGIKGNYDRPSFGAAGQCLIGVLRY